MYWFACYKNTEQTQYSVGFSTFINAMFLIRETGLGLQPWFSDCRTVIMRSHDVITLKTMEEIIHIWALWTEKKTTPKDWSPKWLFLDLVFIVFFFFFHHERAFCAIVLTRLTSVKIFLTYFIVGICEQCVYFIPLYFLFLLIIQTSSFKSRFSFPSAVVFIKKKCLT